MFAKFLKFLIALALIPFVASEIWTFIDLVPKGQWSESWVLSLAAGFVVWLLIFILLPRAMWLYVLGHEFTHALASMLAGGKVSAFKVTSKGGHILTDKVSWWIALSPYFVPIYALIWISLWLTVDFYHPLRDWQPVLYFGLGFFWCFHMTFTVSMLHPRQTDLTGEGIVFSGVVIALMNFVLILFLLAILTHDFPGSGRIFLQRIVQSYAFAGREVVQGVTWLWKMWQTRGNA
ncbi:MAG: hypothetical protein LV481_00330 [Methylacidiphilales bacterium]|nr:hypothetical protein [Candidatus Methylacidiphilales bacterium]